MHMQDILSLERILPTLKNSTSLSAKILWRLLAFQTATAPSATKDFSGGMPQEIMWRAFTSLACSSTIVTFVGRKLYLKMLLLITCQQLIIKKIPYNYQIWKPVSESEYNFAQEKVSFCLKFATKQMLVDLSDTWIREVEVFHIVDLCLECVIYVLCS